MRCQTEAQKVKPILVADKSWAKINRILGESCVRKLECLGEAAGVLKNHREFLKFLRAWMLFISKKLSSFSRRELLHPSQESRVTTGSIGFCFLMCPLLTCPSPLLARLQCPAEVIPDRWDAWRNEALLLEHSSTSVFSVWHGVPRPFVHISASKSFPRKPASHSSVPSLLYHSTWHLGSVQLWQELSSTQRISLEVSMVNDSS